MAVSGTLEKYFVVRIAWVFGLNGKSFIKTMIHVGKTHDEVRVVTCTRRRNTAINHATNAEAGDGNVDVGRKTKYIGRYDLCREFCRQYGLKTKVTSAITGEYGRSKAARAFNCRLSRFQHGRMRCADTCKKYSVERRKTGGQRDGTDCCREKCWRHRRPLCDNARCTC